MSGEMNIYGKRPPGQGPELPYQPDPKKPKIEENEIEEPPKLPYLEKIPLEMQHKIFTFLFCPNRFTSLKYLPSGLFIRISQTSRKMYISVSSFLIYKKQQMIDPLMHQLGMINLVYKDEKAKKNVHLYAKRASIILLDGFCDPTKKLLPNSDLISLRTFHPDDVNGLVYGMNSIWKTTVTKNKLSVDFCFNYFDKKELNEKQQAIVAFVLKYLSISMRSRNLRIFALHLITIENTNQFVHLFEGKLLKAYANERINHILNSGQCDAVACLEDLKKNDPDMLFGGYTKTNIALQIAGSKNTAALDWLKNLRDERFTSVLRSKNRNGANMAHIAAQTGNTEVLEWIFQEEQLHPLLKCKDSSGDTFLFCAVKKMEQIKLIKLIKKIIENENLHSLICETDKSGSTILHYLIDPFRFEANSIFEFLGLIAEKDSLRHLIDQKNDFGQNLKTVVQHEQSLLQMSLGLTQTSKVVQAVENKLDNINAVLAWFKEREERENAIEDILSWLTAGEPPMESEVPFGN